MFHSNRGKTKLFLKAKFVGTQNDSELTPLGSVQEWLSLNKSELAEFKGGVDLQLSGLQSSSINIRNYFILLLRL